MPGWWIASLWVISLDWMSHVSTSMEKRVVTGWNMVDWYISFASIGEKNLLLRIFNIVIAKFGWRSVKGWTILNRFIDDIPWQNTSYNSTRVVLQQDRRMCLGHAILRSPVLLQALGGKRHRQVRVKLTELKSLLQAECSAWVVQPELHSGSLDRAQLWV